MLKVCQLQTDFNAIVSPKIFTQQIWAILNKNTHIHVKEMQLKMIKGKIFKLTSFTHHFSLGNIHRNEN